MSFPVIRNLTTLTSKEGEALLEGKPKGTFLVRVSTRKHGCLVIMFVNGRRKASGDSALHAMLFL